MDRIVSSFPLARLSSTHYGGERNKAESDDTVTAALQQRCEELTRSHQCHTSVCAADKFDGKRRVLDTHGDYNITITGKPSSVKAARGELLRNNPLKIKLSVKATRVELFGPGGELKEILKPTIDKIVADTKANISIAVNNQDRPISGFHSDNYAEINIMGSALAAEAARVRILVLLDELLGLRAETITTIDSKLHNLICGRKRCYLQSIMEETATNIYFQSPFNHVMSDAVYEGDSASLADDSLAEVEPVYITGDSTGIQRAKEMLIKLSNQKAQSLFHKDAVVGARKLDWMLLYRRDELKAVMHDNGSFIMFPPLGSGYDKVTVYAENRVNAERTLRSLYALACQLYEAFFVIQPKDGMLFGVPVVKFYSAYPQIANLVANISQSSGAETTFKSELCIEVFGTERAVRNAYQTINEMNFMKHNHRETIFSVELSVEQREFISGKKNGKINKIMKTSGVKIKFTPHTEYNFLIEVSSNSFTKALDGLTLLQEELPAEISFYVPETYHKRIIGVGGKNIQRIMKKYGVYVKFSNAEEFAALGGYYDNEDNVVARTPAKNAINLDNLRHSVMELVSPKDKDFTSQPVTIPRKFHRCLLVQRGAYLHEVEEKTNCRFRWPDKETASEKIIVHGPETQIHLATGLLLELIPEEYNYRAPFSAELAAVVDSPDFSDLVVSRIKLECNVIVVTSVGSPPPPADCKSHLQSSTSLEVDDHPDNRRRSLTSSSGSSSSAVAACPETSLSAIQNLDQADHSENDYVFVFKFTRNNMDVLLSALEILVDHLKEHQVPLYTDNTPAIVRPRCDSFADAFPHFNSKLLSSVSQPSSESPTTSTFPSYNLFDNGASNAFEWKTFLDDSSSDDLRSAFESKLGGYDTYRRDSGFDISAMSGEVGSASYSESYSPSTKHSQVDIWGPQPKTMHLSGLHGSSSGLYSPQHPSPVATPPPHQYDSNSQNGHQAQYHHTFPGAHRHHRHGASRGLNYDRPVGSTSTSSSTSSSGMSSHRSVPESLAHKELRAMQASRSAFAAASSSSERRYSASQVSHSASRPTRDDYFLHSVGGQTSGGAGNRKDYDHVVAFFEGMNIGYQPLIAGFYPEVAPSTQRINGRASGFDI